MPGLHLVFSPNDLGAVRRHLAPLSTVQHDIGYSGETIYRDSSLELTATRFAEYPISVFTDDRFTLALEGTITNQPLSTLRASLAVIAGLLFDRSEPDRRGIVNWLMERDGDFVIFARETATGRWALLNDLLGRLPLYMRQWGGAECAVSRELSLFIPSGSIAQPDRMAIAQQLLLGFPSGTRTLLAGVERLPSASMLFWSPGEQKLQRSILYTFRFDDVVPSRPAFAIAEALVETFASACRQSAGTGVQAIVSLSGGMDSRAVAAGLLREKAPFRAYTFRDPFGKAERDVQRASELARALHLEWEEVALPAANGADIAHLLTTKPGQLNPMQAIDRRFMQYLLDRQGRTTLFFTGDGGDRLLPCMKPDRTFSSVRSVAETLITRYAQMPLVEVASLMRLSAADIADEIGALVTGYPEVTPTDRYVHYMMYERGIKWAFEGEDRNRVFFRTAAPFFSLSFFRQAVAVPSNQKRHRDLYREFLVRLSPAAAAVPDAARGHAITSPQFRRRLIMVAAISRLPKIARLLRVLRSPDRRYRSDSALLRCLHVQVQECELVREVLEPRVLRGLLDRPERCNSEVLENLFGIVCVIERMSGTTDTLQRFAETEFL